MRWFTNRFLAIVLLVLVGGGIIVDATLYQEKIGDLRIWKTLFVGGTVISPTSETLTVTPTLTETPVFPVASWTYTPIPTTEATMASTLVPTITATPTSSSTPMPTATFVPTSTPTLTLTSTVVPLEPTLAVSATTDNRSFARQTLDAKRK